MTTILAAVLLAFSGGPTSAPQANVVRATVLLSDGGSPIYYVDTRGLDTNTCVQPYSDGGTNGPCLTHMGALRKAPNMLRHLLTVKAASAPDGGVASYPGTYIAGFTCDPTFQSTTAGFLFDGDLVTTAATLGDTPTGTATSGTAGSGVTFGTITQTGKTYTVNALRGYALTTTGGTGAGQVRFISSNTAEVITVVGTFSPSPASGTTYAIQEPGYNFNTAVPTPPTGIAASTANAAAVFVMNTNCNYRASSVTIRNAGFSNPAGAGVQIADNTAFGLNQVRMTGMAGPGITAIQGSSPRIIWSHGSFTGTTSTFAMSSLAGASMNMNNVIAYGSNAGLFQSAIGILGPSLSLSSSEANNSTTAGLVIGSSAPGRSSLSSTRIDCASSAGVGVVVGSSSTTATFSNPASAAVVSLSQLNFGGTCGTGIMVVGPLALAGISSLTGSAATNGMMINWGGRVDAFTGANVTGGTRAVSFDNGALEGTTFTDVAAGGCQLSDAGFSKYDSRLCR